MHNGESNEQLHFKPHLFINACFCFSALNVFKRAWSLLNAFSGSVHLYSTMHSWSCYTMPWWDGLRNWAVFAAQTCSKETNPSEISSKVWAQTYIWPLKFMSTHYWHLLVRSGPWGCILNWVPILSLLKTTQSCGSPHISVCWCWISHSGKCASNRNSQIYTFPESGLALEETPWLFDEPCCVGKVCIIAHMHWMTSWPKVDAILLHFFV